MNERIRELVRAAGLDDPDFPIEDWDNVPLAKFAELIIKDQQRTWVGLTDEEMMLIYVELKTGVGYYSEEKYARAIENALRSKNT